MASLNLPPPAPFDMRKETHNLSTRWEEWATNFKRFTVASGISSESQRREVLLYVGGTQIAETYKQLRQTGDTLDELIKAFKDNFASRDNSVFARYEFRQCTQQPGEAIDSWTARLYKAAEGCQFDTQRDLLIRDQIVAGCQSDQLRRRLLQTANIGLIEALSQARAFEAAESQSAAIEARNDSTVNQVRHAPKPNRNEAQSNSYAGKCLRCGELGHTRRSCDAAKGKTCHNCNKPGHLAKACLSKKRTQRTVHVISTHEQQAVVDDSSDCETFCLSPRKSRLPLVKAIINKHPTHVLIDSGASCNVMNQQTFATVADSSTKLHTSSKRIFSFGADKPLQTHRQC
jgi:hypothetical protein